MKNYQEWFSIKELMDENLPLPSSDKGIVKKAERENWKKRQREGVKGKTFEYHYSSFPTDVQQALGFDVIEQGFTQKADDFDYVKDLSITETGVESKRIAFTKEWLRKMGLDANDCTFFKMPDDGMERTIYKGDRALVTVFRHQQGNKKAHGLTKLEELWKLKDGLYVIRINDRLTIRRVQFDLQKGLFVACDNPLYRELHVAADQIDPTIIIGQVRWYAHTVQWD